MFISKLDAIEDIARNSDAAVEMLQAVTEHLRLHRN